MPELPEVEHLRRSVDPWLRNARILRVEILRADVVEAKGTLPQLARSLGEHSTVCGTSRHGKQMAIRFGCGRAVVVQLGMTGTLRIERADEPPDGPDARHRHVVWWFDAPEPRTFGSHAASVRWRMSFRDPRRFGGLTPLPDEARLREAWKALGADALRIGARDLSRALAATRRPIKAALLDQGTVAGIGNIYADEALHRARIHPLAPASGIPSRAVTALARHLRMILGRAVEQGGSTLRDYRDALGQPGAARQTHAAYGRGGLPCLGCGTRLSRITVVGRTTVFCPSCQDLSTSDARPKLPPIR